jgi:hypothetical protein
MKNSITNAFFFAFILLMASCGRTDSNGSTNGHNSPAANIQYDSTGLIHRHDYKTAEEDSSKSNSLSSQIRSNKENKAYGTDTVKQQPKVR